MKQTIYAILAGISFISFEGLFWAKGINFFNWCFNNIHLQYQSIIITIISLICFSCFIYFMGKSLKYAIKE